MPAIYDKSSIRFMYPENWSLDESGDLAGEDTVTVYSPGGAFWSVSLYPLGADLAELAASALRALKLEYPDSDAEPASESVLGQPLTGYDVNFIYLDLTSTAIVRVLRTLEGVCVILCQAEDREFVELENVFKAMTTSLVQAMG